MIERHSLMSFNESAHVTDEAEKKRGIAQMRDAIEALQSSVTLLLLILNYLRREGRPSISPVLLLSSVLKEYGQCTEYT